MMPLAAPHEASDVSIAPPPALPVKTRDAYSVLMEIGNGAFGNVYLCERKVDGVKLCMKELELTLLSPRDRCLAEVALYQRLPASPFIIGFHEAFWEVKDEKLLLVLEYGDAGDLDAYIHAHRQEPPNKRRALEIFAQIAHGVTVLHAQRILHRDLKAKNVFLFQDGRAVIGDFGTSKSLSSASALGSTLVGSPLNMSPEVLEDEPHSFATDIWSLGCILYELLTWEPPFAAPSYPAVVYKTTQGSYHPLNDSISLDLRDLVAQMLQKDQHKRPTIQEVLLKVKSVMVEQQEAGADCDADSSSSVQNNAATSVKDKEEKVATIPSNGVALLGAYSSQQLSEMPCLPPPTPTEIKSTTASTHLQTIETIKNEDGVRRVPKIASPSAIEILPSARARVAHQLIDDIQIISSERLHMHRQQQQRARQRLGRDKDRSVSSTSHVYRLDPDLPPTPLQPSVGVRQPPKKGKVVASNLAPTSSRSPLPLDNMMIIGTKVNAALAARNQQKRA
ncbi:Nek protein kinase, partial [Globisporangium splendens]